MSSWYMPDTQPTHDDVAVSAYLPGMQSVQYPSVDPPHAERSPAEQLPHTKQLCWPELGWYCFAAALHGSHFATEVSEYWPLLHLVHVLAPGVSPVLVLEPASHSVHSPTLELVEY